MRLRPCAALLPLLLVSGCAREQPTPPSSSETKFLMYVGTYTRETSKGIYAFRFDASSGQAEGLGLVADLRDPSFLDLHPSGKYLYAVTESNDYDADGSGAVSSWEIDPVSGILSRLNEVSSRGGSPCHLNLDSSGRMLIVANYAGGSVASFPVGADGALGEASSFFQHEGGSVHERQEQPHAHSADFSTDDRFAFFSDLGLDQIRVYRANPETAVLAPHQPLYVQVSPGSGPRHFALHPSSRFAYGLNELSSTITVFSFDAGEGELSEVQTISTLPLEYDGESYTAEIYVHPSGRFVYASNRGHNSIAIFAIDSESGRLKARGQVSTQGEWPRNFALDPTGGFLLAANQNTDNIVIFRIDLESGQLEPTGVELKIDAPVCILFLATPS